MGKIWKVPFDELGMIRYSRDYWWSRKPEHFEDSDKVFRATMRLANYNKSNSSAYFTLYDNDGKRYYLNLEHIVDFVQRSSNGEVFGSWTFTKRGTAHGVKLVDNV